jgi:hypothetical protein
MKGRYHLEEVGIDRRIILEWILGKYDGKLKAVFIWFRTRKGGGLLCTW